MNETKHFDIENEKAVVASVLLQGTEALEKALDAGVEPCAIYDERLRLIYRAALKIAARKDPIDTLTVKNELTESGDIDKVDVVFLADITSGIPAALNVKAYAEQVVKDYRQRHLMGSLSNALNAITTDPESFACAKANLLQDLIRHDSGKKKEHQFQQITEDRFRLVFPEVSTTFEVDRLRREHGQLIGELSVRCSLPGVEAYDGNLSIADFNLSSAHARKDRATLLSQRANIENLDWLGHIEEFCQRVLSAERNGQPAIDLRELPKPDADDSLLVEGIKLPRRHSTILFGDGGAAKSYLGLYIGGRLVEQGLTVALFDWELAGEDHRDRLERLFGQAMPRMIYAKCERPLIYEQDRLQRIIRDEKIIYSIFDSIAFACDGPPESAEIAGKYFRAVRQIGGGSLHIAHITKSDGGDQKPFGSVFWHNGARSTYFCKLADAFSEDDVLHIGLFNRKYNLGCLQPATGFKIAFTDDRTYFTREDPANYAELAEGMTIRQRMIHLLRSGSLPFDQVADEIEAEVESVRRTVRRHKKIFTVIDGGQVALLQRDK